MKKSICVIGLGYVGLTLAMHSVRKGFQVDGIEINEETFNSLTIGETHFHEPGLDELVKLSLGKSFNIFKIPPDKHYDYIIITVGTPLISPEDKVPNMDILQNAISSIKHLVNEKNLLVLRSTIPVGSTRNVANEFSDLEEINISFCPERTAEGKALDELQSLPQIISGINSRSIQMANELFEELADEIILADSVEEAELIKLFNNTYRDAIFALSNTFNLIAQNFDLDGYSAIEKSNKNYSRSNIPSPGFVAGPCLEKDAYILASRIPSEDLKDFILNVRKANELLEERVAEKIEQFIKLYPKSKILISGLAFKGVPQTNDLRGSSGIKILNKLTKYKDNIVVHDFMNSKDTLTKLSGFSSIDQEDIFKNFDYEFIIILNNHPRYKSQKVSELINKKISNGTKVIDSWKIMGLENQFSLSNIFIK